VCDGLDELNVERKCPVIESNRFIENLEPSDVALDRVRKGGGWNYNSVASRRHSVMQICLISEGTTVVFVCVDHLIIKSGGSLTSPSIGTIVTSVPSIYS
jgi:hypothetical protein